MTMVFAGCIFKVEGKWAERREVREGREGRIGKKNGLQTS